MAPQSKFKTMKTEAITMLAPRNEAAVAFAGTFLFEDWGFLCTKDNFLAAMEKGDLAEAKRVADQHLFLLGVENAK